MTRCDQGIRDEFRYAQRAKEKEAERRAAARRDLPGALLTFARHVEPLPDGQQKETLQRVITWLSTEGM